MMEIILPLFFGVSSCKESPGLHWLGVLSVLCLGALVSSHSTKTYMSGELEMPLGVTVSVSLFVCVSAL